MIKSTSRTKILILCALLLSSLLIIGCVTPSPAGKMNPEPIKIGAVLSLTGFAQSYGEPSRNGIALAEKEINAAGGINGRLIKVIYEDDLTSGKNAVTAVQKLIEVDKVDALVGGTWDLSLEPIVPIAESAGLIIINPSNGNTKPDSRLSPNLFRTWPSIYYQMNAFKSIITDKRIKTIALIRNSGAWAEAHQKALGILMNETGGKIIADFAGPEVDNNDFRAEISRLKVLKPDAVFIATGYNDAANIVKRMNEQGIDAKVLSSEGALGTAIGLGLINESEIGIAYRISLAPTDPGFIAKYRSEYGKEPGLSADTSYNALKILAKAYNATGTTDTQTVRAYLQSSGDFDENGDAAGEVRIIEVVEKAIFLNR